MNQIEYDRELAEVAEHNRRYLRDRDRRLEAEQQDRPTVVRFNIATVEHNLTGTRRDILSYAQTLRDLAALAERLVAPADSADDPMFDSAIRSLGTRLAVLSPKFSQSVGTYGGLIEERTRLVRELQRLSR